MPLLTTEDQKNQLADILGRVDAIFAPIREWTTALPKVIPHHRESYRSVGLTWHGLRGMSPVEAQRSRQALVADGLLKVSRGKTATRTTGHTLSAYGDAAARAACALPPLALDILDELRGFRSHPDSAVDRTQRGASVWTREITIAGVGYEDCQGDEGKETRKKLVALEERILPAIVRGWAFSRSDIHGRVWYGLADALATGSQPSAQIDLPVHEDLPLPTPEAVEIYYAAFKSFRLSMESSAPVDPREIGELPMPASPILIGKTSDTAST